MAARKGGFFFVIMKEENPNAFKNFINPNVVKKLSRLFRQHHKAFNSKRFEKCSQDFSSLELKQRVQRVRDALRVELPENFSMASEAIRLVLLERELKSFELWPLSEYISTFGVDHFDESFELMYMLTQDFTAEFAIRPFLMRDHNRCLKILSKWAKDENVHVRRLVSEGSRPILPWGGKIRIFLDRPELTLPLLEALKYDDELYVRKSVANHLNDISKHHPKLVVDLLRHWKSQAPKNEAKKIEWITRHALRVLIKKGFPQALKLMGVNDKFSGRITAFKIKGKKLKIGETLEFEISLESHAKKSQRIIIDYLIYFIKADGSLKPKVFKFKTLELEPGESVSLQKKHALKRITTMTFYPGTHQLGLQVNGEILIQQEWTFRS